MNSLENKTLVMLVGPSAIGKSTLMNEVIKIDDRFTRVKTFVTRKPRPNDEPGQYGYLDDKELEEKRLYGELVTETVFPTTGQTYATTMESYSGEYCMLDTLANSVDMYRALPFKRTITITLVAGDMQWQEWFHIRYPYLSEEANKRLEEAKLSINWSLADSQTYWLKNNPGDLAATATALTDIVITEPKRGDVPPEPRAMLELIERGMWT